MSFSTRRRQPVSADLFYHGFQASPLQGNPQGLAVYINGARFNQPFGDTVNWDLIPSIAIDRMTSWVEPGLRPQRARRRARGQMKNGFTYHGAEVDLLGGSFAKYEGELQSDMQVGRCRRLCRAHRLHEGGWRDPQSSDLGNFFWRHRLARRPRRTARQRHCGR